MISKNADLCSSTHPPEHKSDKPRPFLFLFSYPFYLIRYFYYPFLSCCEDCASGSKGTQDGHWELYSVLVFNVYFGDDYDKKFYPWGENCDNNTDFAQIPDDQKLEFIIADINKDSDGDGSPDSVKSKVVSTVFVKNENQTIDGNIVKLDNTNSIGGDFILGATYDPSSSQVNRTALFMDSYTISNINISIYDFEGLPLTPDSTNKVSSLALKYELNSATTAGYGYYSRADGQLIEAVIDIPLSSSDGISFTQNEDKTITFAGQYSPSLTIQSAQFNVTVDFSSTVSPYVIRQAIPGLRIYSMPPSVVVSGVNFEDSGATATTEYTQPTGISYTLKSIAFGLLGNEPTFNAIESKRTNIDQIENTATIYAVAKADNDGPQHHGTFSLLELTIMFEKLPDNCTAGFELQGGASNIILFEREGSGVITKILGHKSQIASWTSYAVLTHTLSAYYGHGTQTIKTI